MYYPFNMGNVTETYRPLLTPTYFADSCQQLLLNSAGNPAKATVGFGTSWPIGILPKDIFDVWANVKTFSYNIDVDFSVSSDFYTGLGGSVDYQDTERLYVTGILKRCFISSGSMFKFAFKSFPKKGSTKTSTDQVIIDFTKGFADYRQVGNQMKNIWWFPYIKLEIAGQTGYILNGSTDKTSLSVEGTAWTPIPFEVRQTTAGVPISNPTVHRSAFQVIERIDDITFTPKSAIAGSTEVTITLPAHNPSYDSSAWREGFTDVVSLSFGGEETTNFTKIETAGVIDTIKVVPPLGSKTGVISFKAIADPTKPDLTTDYYHTQEALRFD